MGKRRSTPAKPHVNKYGPDANAGERIYGKGTPPSNADDNNKRSKKSKEGQENESSSIGRRAARKRPTRAEKEAGIFRAPVIKAKPAPEIKLAPTSQPPAEKPDKASPTIKTPVQSLPSEGTGLSFVTNIYSGAARLTYLKNIAQFPPATVEEKDAECFLRVIISNEGLKLERHIGIFGEEGWDGIIQYIKLPEELKPEVLLNGIKTWSFGAKDKPLICSAQQLCQDASLIDSNSLIPSFDNYNPSPKPSAAPKPQKFDTPLKTIFSTKAYAGGAKIKCRIACFPNTPDDLIEQDCFLAVSRNENGLWRIQRHIGAFNGAASTTHVKSHGLPHTISMIKIVDALKDWVAQAEEAAVGHDIQPNDTGARIIESDSQFSDQELGALIL